MPGYVRHHLILKYYGVLNHSNIFNVYFYKRISLFFLLQVSVQFYFNFKCKKLNIIQFKPLKMYNVMYFWNKFEEHFQADISLSTR